jgi:hypothetical protein
MYARSGDATGGNANAEGGNATAKNVAEAEQSNQSNGSGYEKELTQTNTSSINQGNNDATGGNASATGGNGGDANTGNCQADNGGANASSGMVLVPWVGCVKKEQVVV